MPLENDEFLMDNQMYYPEANQQSENIIDTFADNVD